VRSPQFTIQISDRMYDCHRPAGCTTIAITFADWPGNEFGLWLPETVRQQGERVYTNGARDGSQHQNWVRQANGQYIWRLIRERLTFTSTLTIDEEHSCLWWRYEFMNTSAEPLRELNSQTCFHMVNAPQFISIKGERLWANLDARWITTDQVPRHESPDPRRVQFLAKGLRTERTVIRVEKGFPHATMAEAASHPLFIAENFGATGSVGIASRNFRNVTNNNDYILRCLHSDPMPIDELEPGATAAQDGVLLFSRGDHRKCLEQFKEVTARW
jgi:hypothetical protein